MSFRALKISPFSIKFYHFAAAMAAAIELMILFQNTDSDQSLYLRRCDMCQFKTKFLQSPSNEVGVFQSF